MAKINSINNKTDTLTIESAGEGVLQTDGSGVVSGSKGTDGQVLISSTSGSPSWASITSTGASITITPGSNSINLESAGGSGGVKITKFTSSDTWTKDGDAQMIEYHVWQGGDGGGSGSCQLTGGGSGASAGNYLYSSAVPAFMYPSSASVVIGSGGAGGIAKSSYGNGNGGLAAGITSFLSFTYYDGLSVGGPGGANGTVGPADARYFFSPFSALETTNYMVVPQSGTGETTAGGDAENLSSSSFTYGKYCCAGSGGGGGGANGMSSYAGGTGSGIKKVSGSADLVAPTAGGTSDGGAGANGLDNTATGAGVLHGGLGGGGGGGSASFIIPGGDGGDGGIPGGGGGGGGCNSEITGTSGAGGSGARGEVLVIEYLG